MKGIGYLLIVFGFLQVNAQTDYKGLGKIFRFSSHYSMFPDSLRNVSPRVYQGKTYTAAEHYNDSSVLVFVPKYFKRNKAFRFVFYMHGWNNNIDSALQQFQLIEQFYAAHQNAILVFPEGPKNSPDSYAGKFEQNMMFSSFCKDIFYQCYNKKIVSKSHLPMKIILAGHSGAYRAIAKIILNNTIQPVGILLFDALYGEEQVFENYLKTNNEGKLICIYTNNGGTLDNCKKFMAALDAGNLKYLHKEEDDCTAVDLESNRVIFLHSNKTHNEVITNNNNFERFLKVLF